MGELSRLGGSLQGGMQLASSEHMSYMRATAGAGLWGYGKQPSCPLIVGTPYFLWPT